MRNNALEFHHETDLASALLEFLIGSEIETVVKLRTLRRSRDDEPPTG